MNLRFVCDMLFIVIVIFDIFFLYCIYGWDYCVFNYILIIIKEDNC